MGLVVHLLAGALARLLLSTGEVLLELVVAAAGFEPLEEILTVCVVDDGPLVHAGQALEDATAGAAVLLINVDNSVALRNVVAFNAGCVLGSLLALADHAGVVLRGGHV